MIGSPRRECLDHVIIFNDRHLERMLREYLAYCHAHRTHQALEHDGPAPRPIEVAEQGEIVELPLVGGLHHRYTRQAA
jgi:putative transposase